MIIFTLLLACITVMVDYYMFNIFSNTPAAYLFLAVLSVFLARENERGALLFGVSSGILMDVVTVALPFGFFMTLHYGVWLFASLLARRAQGAYGYIALGIVFLTGAVVYVILALSLLMLVNTVSLWGAPLESLLNRSLFLSVAISAWISVGIWSLSSLVRKNIKRYLLISQ